MTQYTPNHSLPYPDGTDPVVVHSDLERLAKKADAEIVAVKDETISAAATDATTKANAAKNAAIQDATQKYGGLPARVTSVETGLTAQGETVQEHDQVLTTQGETLSTHGEALDEHDDQISRHDDTLKEHDQKLGPVVPADDDTFRILDRHGRLALGVTERGAVLFGGAEHQANTAGYRVMDKHGRVAFEVDENGRTQVYDPAFEISDGGPVRTHEHEKFVPNPPEQVTYYPTYLDRNDRTTMINYNSVTLRYSRDEGETWHISHTFADPVRSGLILDNGDCLISTRREDTPYEIWLSSGWMDNPETATWEKVHEGGSLGTYPSGAFSWSHHENIVVMSEYGPKLGQAGVTEAARYAFLSRDYGKSWTRIFDLLTDVPELTQTTGMHIHGALFDPYWDRIWITYGDDENGTVFSDDLGRTWHTAHHDTHVNGLYQLVGMYALPQCVLFASDGHPNGVVRIDRTDGKHQGPYDFQIGYLHDNVQGLTILCQSVWRANRPGDDAPVVFEFVSAPGEGRRFILTTADGYTFNKVWEDPDITRGNSSGRAYGPTASGRLLHYAVDEYFTPGGRTLRQGPMPNAY